LGCSPLWPISEQRGEMNPVPATKKLLEKSRSFYLESSDACIFLRTKEKIRLQSNRSFFGLFLSWNFPKQRGGKNPVPATKKTS
jgi:hypothetical protein